MFGAKKKFFFPATQLEDGDSVWNLSAQWTKFRLIVSLTVKRGATLEIIRKYNVRNAREVEGRQTDGRTVEGTDGTDRQTEIQTNEQTDKRRETKTYKQKNKLTERDIERQKDKQTDEETDRKTDK